MMRMLIILLGLVCASSLPAQVPEICDNGIDDDSDGLIDCDDSECAPGTFFDSGQSFGNSYSIGAAIGDIDSDGDLDVWIANSNEDQADQLWLNDGTGQFSNSGQILGNSNNYNVEFGDIDGDGDLDAITTGRGIPPFPPSRVWFNDGAGIFTVSDQSLPTALRARLGDLDLDGDLDAWLSRAEPGLPNLVYLNNGQGEFFDSGQTLGSSFTYDVFLGDLDADGDLDAFAANNSLQPNRVWLNDGAGFFFDSGQSLGNGSSHGVALGDVDNDGDLDAWIANSVAASTGGQPNRVWINDGMGNFTDSGQSLGNSVSAEVALGDLDGDGALDAWVANVGSDSGYTEPNRVWINDGQGNFSDGGQSLGDAGSFGIVLGDLDGDGDLDAWVANIGPNRIWINQGHVSCNIDEICDNGIDDDSDGLIDCVDSDCISPYFSADTYGDADSRRSAMGDLDNDGDQDIWVANYTNQPNQVWLNQGGIQGGTAGAFLGNGQSLGNSASHDVALGDLDMDGDLDAFVANDNEANRVWFNDGQGNFTDSGQSLGNSAGREIALSDLDGDGDLDAWVANIGPNRVWINDGLGNFSDSGQTLGNSNSVGMDLGDLDQDGDLDAWIANDLNQPDKVWFNDGFGNFSNSGQTLGNSNGHFVSLGDLDDDGDLDAWVANNGNQPNSVWINNGLGNFSNSGQALGSAASIGITLGDLDNDGDLDAWVANIGPNRVWINQGGIQGGTPATYSDSGQELGDSLSIDAKLNDFDEDGDLDAWITNIGVNRLWLNEGNAECFFDEICNNGIDDDEDGLIDCEDPECTPGDFILSDQEISGSGNDTSIALADIDNDGDLDAWIVASENKPMKLWLNNGEGTFDDSGQDFGLSNAQDVSLGDIDGDGDNDAWVAMQQNEPNEIWLNDGSGAFTNSMQELGNSFSLNVTLDDLDGDGDLDAWVTNGGGVGGQPNRLWINDGIGNFSPSPQTYGNSPSMHHASGDLDGDGDIDVWVANYNGQPNRVWINDGSGEFTDSGQSLGSSSTHCVGLGDFDNDGDTDLYITNDGPDRLLMNDGTGRYTDETFERGIQQSRFGSAVSTLDVDQDGDLDIFLGHYVEFSAETFQPCMRDDLEVYCAPMNYPGIPCVLLINDGNGFFSDASKEAGLEELPAKALGILTADIDLDGDTDIYVANDGEANFLLINQFQETGLVRFTDQALISGCALGEDAKKEAGMGVDGVDLDEDGDEEILVTNFEAQTNSCYRNDGNGLFLETSFINGMGSPSLPWVGFGIRSMDINLDTMMDIFVTNGHVIDNIGEVSGGKLSLAQPDHVYLGTDRGFVVSEPHAHSTLKAGRSAISGDLDNDGDLDLILTCWQDTPRILRSTAAGDTPVIGIELIGDGKTCPRDAIGAKIEVKTQDQIRYREHRVQSSYLASHDPRQLFALKKGQVTAEVSIQWPGGKRETTVISAGSYHRWEQGKGITQSTAFRAPKP